MRNPIACGRSALPRPRTGAAWPLRVTGLLLLWLTRVRRRHTLHGLSDHLLKDIGVSRAGMHRETGKRFRRG